MSPKAFETVPNRRLRVTPQASARLARAELGQRAGVRANWDRRPLRSPALVAVRTFSKSAILHSFSSFYTLRVYIFRMFLSVHVYL